tara:strand:- start:1037 stop:1219 length:183 start_codon:yes stop_codon:yes gene_type:complete
MKTFNQFMSEMPNLDKINSFMDFLQRAKMSQSEKRGLAKMTAKEVEDTMVKKYQLPTKVV